MFGKGSKLYSILNYRCPKCHEGKMFKNPNPYEISDLTKMHDSCEVCGESFLREPGFYFGAAYVSYALTVALWVAVLVALLCFDWWGLIEFSFFENPLTFFISGLATLVIGLPILYRLSRSIWINFFVKYDPHAKESAQAGTAKEQPQA
ncbi:MAG: DUF983 domain-containing protein [Flavobacteriales bacterium]|nr:DUF983 domain-containing protein [Flavobacteriales bacterium]